MHIVFKLHDTLRYDSTVVTYQHIMPKVNQTNYLKVRSILHE